MIILIILIIIVFLFLMFITSSLYEKENNVSVEDISELSKKEAKSLINNDYPEEEEII